MRPIHFAARKGDIETLEKLVKQGVSIDEKDQCKNIQATPLLYAVQSADLKTVKWLVAHGANIFYKNKNNSGALEFATVMRRTKKESKAIVHYLCQQGLKFEYSSFKHSYYGDIKELEACWQSGKNACSATKHTALHYAVSGAQIATAKWLLGRGSSLKEKNKYDYTALLCAARNGHQDIVKWLLDNGASLQEKDRWGKTVLLCAAWYGHQELVQWLLEKGASLQEKDMYGKTALLCAARNGYQDVVQLLLEKGASLQEKDNDGSTALLLAALNGHQDLVKWLLANGASLQEKDKYGKTALLCAARNGHQALVQWLLEKEASLQEKDRYGKTALLCAARNGHQDVVQLLLEKGVVTGKDNDGSTALLLAALNGHQDLVKWLLANGASLQEKDRYGKTALLCAARNGHQALVQWLLKNGASLQEKDNDGSTALLLAALNGHQALVQWLLEKKASLQEKDRYGKTALLCAARNGHQALVQWLLKNGALLQEKDNDGSTALLLAALNGHQDLVKWLLANGASLQEKDRYGKTALLCAARNGHQALVQWLLKNGASLQEKDRYGKTALLCAACNGHKNLVNWLLDNKASLNKKNNKGKTALLLAALNGHQDLVKWLLANGASLQEKDKYGKTALLCAALNGHQDLVQWLLKNGASLQEKNNSGNTALLCAAWKGHQDLVQWLLDNGASLQEKDKYGKTALSLASEQNHEAVIYYLRVYDSLLVKKKALPNLELKNISGYCVQSKAHAVTLAIGVIELFMRHHLQNTDELLTPPVKEFLTTLFQSSVKVVRYFIESKKSLLVNLTQLQLPVAFKLVIKHCISNGALNLSYFAHNPASMKMMFNLLNDYSLLSIKLANAILNPLPKTWLAFCQGMAAYPYSAKLRTLQLSGLQLTSKQLKVFVDKVLLKLLSVETLDLTHNAIEKTGMNYLIEAITPRHHLITIKLDNNLIELSGSTAFNNVHRSIDLEAALNTLSIAGNYIVTQSDSDFKKILKFLLKVSKLTVKDFGNCKWEKLEPSQAGYCLTLSLRDMEVDIELTARQRQAMMAIQEKYEQYCPELAGVFRMLQSSVKKALKSRPHLAEKKLIDLQEETQKNQLCKYLISYRQGAPLKHHLLRDTLFQSPQLLTVQSQWANNKTIKTDKWLVYLIVYKKVEHALMAIEGLHKNGQRFHIIAELKLVKSRLSSKIVINTTPWQELIVDKCHIACYEVNSKAAKMLYQQVLEEINNGVDYKYKKWITGLNSSVLSQQQKEALQKNCLTWVLDKFDQFFNIKIPVPTSGLPSHAVLSEIEKQKLDMQLGDDNQQNNVLSN